MGDEHPGHPGQDHCDGCYEEEYGEAAQYAWTGLWSFDDARPKCCCRDERESED